MEKLNTDIFYIRKLIKKPDIWAYFGIVLVLIMTYHPRGESDTQALLFGVDYALECISANLTRLPCGTAVVHFPIFQYLIAVPFKLAGLDDASILIIFSYMNLGWFILSTVVFWRAGFLLSGKPGGHLGLLVLLSGYVIWYMSTSFNEAASFALFSLLSFSIIDRWRLPYVCALSFACTITKEVAFPFVFYFMFVSFVARESRANHPLHILKSIFPFFSQFKFCFASILGGILVNLSFNYFRYGSINNIQHLNSVYFTPWSYVPKYFAYLIISPAGGLLFTWLSLCLLLLMPLLVIKLENSIKWIVGLLVFGLVISNLGLARWYSPFGWSAWGPRLTLPILGAVGVPSVYLLTPQVIKFFRGSGKTYGLIILFCLVSASSLPNLSVRLDDSAFFSKMFAATNVAIGSGIKNFTVESTPVDLYVTASSESYSRNVVLPTSFNVALRRWPISLLWFFSLYLISRLIFTNTYSLLSKNHE